MESYNAQSPYFGQRQPDYPPMIQLVRVTSATVPGPSGYTSSSVQAANLYVGSTQQLGTGTLFPRDREPCLALDVNGFGLMPGYYLGRLAGSWTSLPVYEVCFLLDDLAAITPSQKSALLSNLTPAQLSTLDNLNVCQFQVLLGSNPSSSSIPNIPLLQQLTTALTATQLGTLVGQLSIPQLTPMLGTLTTTQLQNLSNSLSGIQLETLLHVLSVGQFQTFTSGLNLGQLQALGNNLSASQLGALVPALSVGQLQTLASSLSSSQLQALANHPSAAIAAMVSSLAFSDLVSLLNKTPPVPNPIIGSQQVFPYVPAIIGSPSSTPSLSQGYAPVIVDQTDGRLYGYFGGSWTNLSIGGGGGISSAYGATEFTGTTTNAFVTVFDKVNSNGLHGTFSAKNTGSNGMTLRVVLTDMYGNNVTSSTSNIATSVTTWLMDMDSNTFVGSPVGGVFPPFKEIKLQIEDQISGSHTTYDIWLSLNN